MNIGPPCPILWKVGEGGRLVDETAPRPFAFILMPFDRAFDDVYQLGIRTACKDAGAYCERVDEQMYDGSILERLYNQIAKADIIVADMTGRNANVFYETGYAHALDKQVILLTQDAADIPFDLSHYPHIVYGGRIVELKTQLERRVRWCIENPKKSLSRVDVALELFVCGIPLENAPTVHTEWVAGSRIPLKVDIHNANNRAYESDSFKLALITSDKFTRVESQIGMGPYKNARLSDGRIIHLMGKLPSMLPNDWESTKCWPAVQEQVEENEVFEMIFRVLTELGVEDYPFSVLAN